MPVGHAAPVVPSSSSSSGAELRVTVRLPMLEPALSYPGPWMGPGRRCPALPGPDLSRRGTEYTLRGDAENGGGHK
jgi:hypothetical protein